MKTAIRVKAAELVGNKITLDLATPYDLRLAKAFIDDFEHGKEYKATLEKTIRKRSLNANDYCWTLIGQLASVINLPSQDIYRSLVRDIGGVSEIVAVRDYAYDTFKKAWESRGIAWMVDKLDEMHTPDGLYYKVECWHGSSDYNTAQMARLIDLVVQDCKAAGLETMTPDELARLKGLTE